MPRMTIEQFRAALADRSSPGALVRVYRELARRPELAGGVVYGDWPVWNQMDAPAVA